MLEATNPVEVNGLAVVDRVKRERAYLKQWGILRDHFEKLIEDDRFNVTHITMEEDPGLRLLAMEVLGGTFRENKRVKEAQEKLATVPSVTLATVDGRPFADPDPTKNAHIRGVKRGVKPLDAKRVKQLRKQGRSPYVYARYGSVFTVSASEALDLLLRYGYRIRDQRIRRRGTPGEVDMWILYEVGGPLEEEVLELFAEVRAQHAPKPEPKAAPKEEPKPSAAKDEAKASAPEKPAEKATEERVPDESAARKVTRSRS